MTYGELYHLFLERNKDLAGYINDYRPAPGENRLQIWFKNGLMHYVKYVKELDRFIFSAPEKYIDRYNMVSTNTMAKISIHDRKVDKEITKGLLKLKGCPANNTTCNYLRCGVCVYQNPDLYQYDEGRYACGSYSYR